MVSVNLLMKFNVDILLNIKVGHVRMGIGVKNIQYIITVKNDSFRRCFDIIYVFRTARYFKRSECPIR